VARRGKSVAEHAKRALSKIDLHIVSFNVPLPADYGGVIDVFYKLEALSKLGYNIALHCFDYGRGELPELEKYAAEVYYYSRNASPLNALFLSPFSVKSRKSEKLLQRLASDDAPILFESLQCCYYLDHPKLAQKQKWVRAHNVEHDYYRSLSRYENASLRKTYYFIEAKALERFEKVLFHADGVFAISPKDTQYFKSLGLNSSYLPAFYRQSIQVDSTFTIKQVALYQGNLKVEENVKAVLFLLEVFSELPHELIIAGSEPGKVIVEKAAELKNVTLIENPSDEVMFDLIKTAKISCLPTFQATGIKLKLLHALTSGNEVMVNSEMIDGTGLAEYCTVTESIDDWREQLTQTFSSELDLEKILKRQLAIAELFDNQKNAKQLAESLGLAQ
jgi:hypothetical protein